MKTLHLGIIIISVFGLSLTINHVYAPCAINVQCGDLHPSDNKTSVDYPALQNSSKIGPAWILGIPTPLQQFKSGVKAQDVKCQPNYYPILIIKSEDGSPACVKPGTATKLVERGWTRERVTVDSLANDMGVITLDNQTYYFETPGYSQDAYTNSPQISFHGVTFTLFPSGFMGGLPVIHCGLQGLGLGQYYWADSKFSDDTHELLHFLAYSPTACNLPIPSMFSNHTNPQAGLAFYDGKMKLLVSADNSDLSKSPISSIERIRVIPEYPITTGIDKNGTITDSETIEILFDNFKQNLPLVVQILDPQGGVYKTDNIPPGHIQSDGFYKYQIYIKGNESAMGKYTVAITHGNARASISTYLSNAVP